MLQASAVVTLANGLRFEGSLARNLDQAAESAASHALLTMVSCEHFNDGMSLKDDICRRCCIGASCQPFGSVTTP